MKKQPADDAPVRKFTFDLAFDEASVAHRASEPKPVLMKADQIEALKKESYNAGFEAGKAAGKEEQTAALSAIFETVGQNIDALVQNFARLSQEQETHTRQLVLAIAKKLLPDFAARNGFGEIEALIGDAIRQMAREPRLVIRVNETQFDAVNEKAEAIASQRAYSGKIIVLADAEVAAGDCRVEWADGGVERNTQAVWNAVEETISPPV